jgi:single-strand DNA-binding protein
MSIGYNHTEIVGRIAQAPVYKDLGDKKVITFSVAIPKGPKSDKTDFIPCIAWDSRAEFIHQYFKAGDLILIDGKLDQQKWTDDNGNNRQKIQVKVNSTYFMETKESKQLRQKRKSSNNDSQMKDSMNSLEEFGEKIFKNDNSFEKPFEKIDSGFGD